MSEDKELQDVNGRKSNKRIKESSASELIREEIDLVDLGRTLWQKRRMIFRNTIICAVLAIVVAFSIPKEYVTVVSIAPENNAAPPTSGGVASLAAMAGLNLGLSGVDGITPSLYPDIVASTPFLMEIKDMKVTKLDDKGTFTLYEYLTEHQNKAWWSYLMALPEKLTQRIKSLFLDNNSAKDEEWNTFHLTKGQLVFFTQLKSSIVVEEQKKTGIILTSVTMQDPQIAAEVADSIVSKLQDYMINYKTEKARKDLAYAEKLYTDARIRYFDIQKLYAQYEDANRNVISASYAIEKDRLQNEVTLAFSIYNSLSQQVEMAKAKVQQDTPVLTVLEPATVSLKANSPNKKMILAVFVSLGLIISIGYIMVIKIINK